MGGGGWGVGGMGGGGVGRVIPQVHSKIYFPITNLVVVIQFAFQIESFQ